MNADHYAAVRRLYETVADLPPSQRSAHLQSLSNDAALIAEVLDLFQAGESATTGWINRPLRGALQDALQSEVKPGDVIGAWRIESELGQGGMGQVFRVARCDGHFEQLAAMKLLQGAPSRERLAHLARERQVLAKLTHPNIARLYDGGETDHGQPYLVMELVDGVAIDRYCQDRQLSRNAILNLFIEASQAVAFAHRQLIVHCDLKPSNLLINRDGRPILLDFGIARLHQDDAAEGDPDPALHAFTPRYASPEQRGGDAITTSSDIFSLGLLLAELLDQHRLSDAELAAVVAKASAEVPSDRYASVDALCDDLRRYQSHQPLLAVRARRTYRTRKFVQRHWPWLLVAALFVVIVSGFTLRVLRESERARAAEHQALADRDHAREAEAASRQTNDFLISIFNASNPNAESGDLKASTLISAAEQRLDTEMKGQPAIQAEILSALGLVQANMGQRDAGRRNLERAIAIERGLDRPLVLATMLMRLSVLVTNTDGIAAGEVFTREALTLRETHGAPDSVELAESLNLMASTLSQSGRPQEAVPMYERALAILKPNYPDSTVLADTYAAYGMHERYFGKLERALLLQEQGLAIAASAYGERHPNYLANQLWYAYTLSALRRSAEAETAFRRNLSLRKALHGDGNMLVVEPMIGLATMLNEAQRPDEALAIAVEAQAITARSASPQSVESIAILNNIAAAHYAKGRFNEAAKACREALDLMAERGDRGPQYVQMQTSLIAYYTQAGDLRHAGLVLDEAEPLAQTLFPADHYLNVTLALNRAAWLLRSGRPSESRALVTKIEAALPKDDPKLSMYETSLRNLHQGLDEVESPK
ncbi:hypothetical protein C7S18_03175 [Ahniella affigens]|uniref:Protein kinase domain-containing protein n=1 Tax=Ahniella affigens TaxID=2021234 RepID=A0A2P1PN41_9GAMM|nr:serine/threonine-protein kinase [Ahniella affigens]AVP96252.1 hypothetical protein C7S18_03175 [Ahniella affigens]